MTKGEMINSVYRANITKRATLVVFYLINRADKEMTCFPGIKTIAADCNMSKRTVQRALNDLVEAGIIMKDSRYRENGGQSSNLYILCINDSISDEIANTETKNTIGYEQQEDINKIDFKDYLDVTEDEAAIDKSTKKIELEYDEILFINQMMKKKACIITLIKFNKNIICHGEADRLVPP
jgi:predicted transcriptional regulator